MNNFSATVSILKADRLLPFCICQVEAETEGWMGLGLSPSGSMADSDIVVMWVDGEGEVFCQVS